AARRGSRRGPAARVQAAEAGLLQAHQARRAMTALHVRGVVLPDDEVRDLWLVGDRVTLSPMGSATTVASQGFILPGLVDAHCHIGIRPGGGPIASLAEALDLAWVERAAGVLAIRDAGSPFPYAVLDDNPDVPRLVRAGRHV